MSTPNFLYDFARPFRSLSRIWAVTAKVWRGISRIGVLNINNLPAAVHYPSYNSHLNLPKPSKMPEILGPHFYSRVFKEEGEKGGDGRPDAAPREEYLVELSATGLGMKDTLDPVPVLGTDLIAIGFSGGGNTGDDQWEKVGSATCFISKTHFQQSKKNFISCTIEHLDVNTGDTLTDVQAFAAIVRRIQSLCIDNDAEHLAMTGSESFRMSSGLFKHTGFTPCDCEHPSRNVRVGSQSQLCMDLPSRPARSSVHKDQDHPMDSSSTRERDHVTAPVIRTAAARTTNTGVPSAEEKKDYCRYWIWNGRCMFTPSCKFKHEIPLDKETRENIGMGPIPEWFKKSDHWGPWLQQVDPAEREELTRDGRNVSFLARPSGGSSDPRARGISSRGEGKATTKPRGPGNLGAYMVGSPRQYPDQDTVASNIKAEGSRLGPASATAIESTNVINNRTAKRRRNRQRHRRQGAPEPSVAVKREGSSMEESSGVWGSDAEDQLSGPAKRIKLEFERQ